MLASLPKSAHPGAKNALAEIYNAENKTAAAAAAKGSADDYGKWPEAVSKIIDDLEEVREGAAKRTGIRPDSGHG